MTRSCPVSIWTLLFLTATFFAFHAQAQTVENIAAPSGVTVHYVKCSGKAGKCLNKAAAFCNGSYQVIDSESHAGGLFADFIPGPVRWYSMTFLCGKSDGIFPEFVFRGPEWEMPSIIIPRTWSTTCRTSFGTTTCTTY